MTAAAEGYRRPLAAIMTAVVRAVAYLIQSELAAARVAVDEKLRQLISGGVALALAMALALPGCFVLFLALARWLSIAGLAEQWSLTLVGVGAVAVSAVLAIIGVRSLTAPLVLPETAIAQLRGDLALAQEAGV